MNSSVISVFDVSKFQCIKQRPPLWSNEIVTASSGEASFLTDLGGNSKYLLWPLCCLIIRVQLS